MTKVPSGLDDLKTLLDAIDTLGVTRYLQTPAFGNVLTTADSTPQPIRFTRPGFVTGIYGNVQSGAVGDYAGTTLRVQIGGVEDIFVDGQGGPAFVPFFALFGGIQNRAKLVRRVQNASLWVFTCHNNTAATVVPLVEVGFVDDEDVRNILAALKDLQG